jgi:hypothetical protein
MGSFEFKSRATQPMSRPADRLEQYVQKQVMVGITRFVPEEIDDLVEILKDRELVRQHPKHEYIEGVLEPVLRYRHSLDAQAKPANQA